MYDKIPHHDTVTEVQIPQAILDLFKDSAVQYDASEGQRVRDGIVYLGLRCGPAYCWDALVHEIAHFIEIDEARMDRDAWGFRWPYDEEGRPINFTTSAHIERELRVFAISLHLFEYAGFNIDPEDLTSSLHWMDYWSVYGEVDKIQIPEGEKMPSFKVFDRKMQIWGARKVREYYKNYDIDSLLAEWKRRNEVLKNRAEQ